MQNTWSRLISNTIYPLLLCLVLSFLFCVLIISFSYWVFRPISYPPFLQSKWGGRIEKMNLMDQMLTSIRSLFMSGTNGCSSVAGNEPHFTFLQLHILRCSEQFFSILLGLPCFGSSISKSHCWGPSGQSPGHGFHSKLVLFKKGTPSVEVLNSELSMEARGCPSASESWPLMSPTEEDQELELQGTCSTDEWNWYSFTIRVVPIYAYIFYPSETWGGDRGRSGRL